MPLQLPFNRKILESFCQENGIRKLALFGSVVRDDFTPESDVDVLVDFKADSIPNLYKYADLVEALTIIFGRRVDLVTYDVIHPRLRAEILSEAEVQYDEAR